MDVDVGSESQCLWKEFVLSQDWMVFSLRLVAVGLDSGDRYTLTNCLE